MGTLKYFFTGLIVISTMISCDKGFDKMNINPVALTSTDPAFQLNSAIMSSTFAYNTLQYESIIVKQMQNPYSGVGAAGQYNQDNRSVTSQNWIKYYRSVIKLLADNIDKLKDDSSRANLYNMTRIWKAYTFMILTDTYGDIPYSQAGMGYLEGVVTPVYDTQESIYADLLNELETASAALNTSKPNDPRDILYGGSAVKWKRLGYSLLLRGGMRLSKVDPTSAKKYIEKAIAGGVMKSNDDNAVIRNNANFQNSIGANLSGGQRGFFYLAQDFVTYLKTTSDPRLASIAVRYVGAESTTDLVEARANRNPSVQIGMPLGYDNTTIAQAVAIDNLASLYDYSQLDITRMASPQAPTFFVTYGQTQLLLAEAIARNWSNGDAGALYASGIRASMAQFSLYGASSAIKESDIDSYILANPFNVGDALELINTQYWIASFLNGPEAWSNFRRSGFPALTPNPFPGSDLHTEDFIRRLTYPDAEINVNHENVQKAIDQQGPDVLDTRVWWDVK
jgi:hypothetical protein